MRKAWGFVLIVSLLGLPGVGVLVVGIRQAAALYRFQSSAAIATGRVVSLTLLRSGEEIDTYNLVVEYPLPDGTSRRYGTETSNSSYSEGQSVAVAYTTTPLEARLSGVETDWTNPVIFIVMGLAWTSFAVLIITVGLRHQAASVP